MLGQLRAGGGRDLLLPAHCPSPLQEQPWSVYGAAAPQGTELAPKGARVPSQQSPSTQGWRQVRGSPTTIISWLVRKETSKNNRVKSEASKCFPMCFSLLF